MMPLQTSYDSDGFYEGEELDDLLREESTEDTNPASDDSVVVYRQTSHDLKHRHRKYLQKYPPDSIVWQIIKRLENEGVEPPFYLFWPWPVIRTVFNGLMVTAFILIAVFSVVQLALQNPTCESGKTLQWWMEGPLLFVNQLPSLCLPFVEKNAVVLKDNGVRSIGLGSPVWSANIRSWSLTSNVSGMLEQIDRLCHGHGFKVVMTIYAANISCYLHKNDKNCIETLGSSGSGGWNTVFSSLISVGIDGFYFADLEKLPSPKSRNILRALTNAAGNDSGILIGADIFETTAPELQLTGVDVNFEPKSAAVLKGWIQDHIINGNGTHLLMKTNNDMRWLTLLLPGVPVLDESCIEDLSSHGMNNQTQLQRLLQLRKNSVALQGKTFLTIQENSHKKNNVFAMLRMYNEEKRYLVIWNFNNFTVELDFHWLSMEGKWVFRTVVSVGIDNVDLKHIKGVQAFEFGIIELP